MKVGVIGLGYVGLPLAVAFAEAAAEVVGVDVDEAMVESLARGESTIEDIPSERLTAARRRAPCRHHRLGRALADCDAIVICVPTPLAHQREPDLSYVDAAGRDRRRRRSSRGPARRPRVHHLPRHDPRAPRADPGGVGPRRWPGLPPRLLARADRPGRTDYTVRTTPKVVGGLTEGVPRAATDLYGLICDHVVAVSSPEVAELTKLLENIFRSVNIALVNELAILADRMGIDVWEVIEAASTKPFGFMRFDPGPGMGGHCLPIDPFYLAFKAREYDFPTEFIELAGRVNQAQPHFCVDRAVRA